MKMLKEKTYTLPPAKPQCRRGFADVIALGRFITCVWVCFRLVFIDPVFVELLPDRGRMVCFIR